MNARAIVYLAVMVLAGCGTTKSEAQTVSDRSPYLSVCRPTTGGAELLLFDSRLAGGVQSTAFFTISGKKLAKLVSFPATWNETVPKRIKGLPAEADHYMMQRGANMEGQRILSGYELIMPMKTVPVGQQMVGEDQLRLRHDGRLWTATCRQLDPNSEEYHRFLAGEVE